MKHFIFTILSLLILLCPQYADAQKNISDAQRKQYAEKLLAFKHQILTRELDLTRDQANKFFPIYDKMEAELERIGRETRILEQKTLNNPTATTLECESTAYALFEQKKNEAEIELRYFEQFKNILEPRQLLKLKSAERKFRAEILKYYNNSIDD